MRSTPRHAWPLALLAPLFACAGPTRASGGPGGEDPRNGPPSATSASQELVYVIFGTDTVRVEVARTEEERARGLMFRDELAPGTGMLFVFDEAEVQGVWMKETRVPLDAAFLDPEGVILNIEPLEPGDLTVKYADGPVLYVLEVPRGWFAAHGVVPGDRARIVIEGSR